MRITEIDYQKLKNGKVRIVDIRNAATRTQIGKEFGSEECDEYLHAGGPSYRAIGQALFVRTRPKGPRHRTVIRKGDIISKEKFTDVINTMKLAALRLIEIREDKKPPVKTVSI